MLLDFLKHLICSINCLSEILFEWNFDLVRPRLIDDTNLILLLTLASFLVFALIENVGLFI